MRKRRFGHAVGLFVVAVTLAGCGSTGSGSDDPAAEARGADVRVTASPAEVRAGDEVALTFATPHDRGVAWWMTAVTGDARADPSFLLIATSADGYRPCAGCARWFLPDDGGWEDPLVSGAGSDVVLIPPIAEPGEHRICSVHELDLCASVSVLPG